MKKIKIYTGSALVVATIGERFEVMFLYEGIKKFFIVEDASRLMEELGELEIDADELLIVNREAARYRCAPSAKKEDFPVLHEFMDKVLEFYKLKKAK